MLGVEEERALVGQVARAEPVKLQLGPGAGAVLARRRVENEDVIDEVVAADDLQRVLVDHELRDEGAVAAVVTDRARHGRAGLGRQRDLVVHQNREGAVAIVEGADPVGNPRHAVVRVRPRDVGVVDAVAGRQNRGEADALVERDEIRALRARGAGLVAAVVVLHPGELAPAKILRPEVPVVVEASEEIVVVPLQPGRLMKFLREIVHEVLPADGRARPFARPRVRPREGGFRFCFRVSSGPRFEFAPAAAVTAGCLSGLADSHVTPSAVAGVLRAAGLVAGGASVLERAADRCGGLPERYLGQVGPPQLARPRLGNEAANTASLALSNGFIHFSDRGSA